MFPVVARSRWEAVIEGPAKPPANETFGFEIIDASDPQKSISFTWTVPHEYCNSTGNLQGGVLAAFADALLGAAASAHISEDHYPALAEMKISILRPASEGARLTGRGYVVKPGKRVLFTEAEITDSEGKLIARASATEIPTRV